MSLLVIWRVGPGKLMNIEGFEGIARAWPLAPLPPEQAYVLRQALGQALYHALGWTGTDRFLVLHLAVLLLSGLVLAGWLVRRLGIQRGAIAVCLLVVSPVTAVLLEWIGMYDAFSVFVWVLLLLVLGRNPWLQGAVAFLGGVQNFEQFVVSVVLLALLPELTKGLALRVRPIALLVGALGGKVALELYLRSAGAANGSRASFLTDPDMQRLVLTSFALLAPVIVWTVLGGLWVPLLRRLPAVWASAPRGLRVRGLLAAALVLGIGIVSADHTRVMVLISFPLLVLLCVRLALDETSVSTWLRRPDTWLVLLTPTFVIVSGNTPLPLGIDPSLLGL
ncbi:hypothetical protein [Modestobacter sp. VKM Ac-2985]|uniref:hypothetical protein n=1 Tax=Modestobacter sp. VKM Ac-2985 TaxID=3004139 RepID=UPI0022AB6E55|nr:hypothetical protein [Modestobacter sp. VKM Ac-2985]MCZ2838598.1 hypothetical protein [Modestobacter sp. VKM Ac-2985]